MKIIILLPYPQRLKTISNDSYFLMLTTNQKNVIKTIFMK